MDSGGFPVDSTRLQIYPVDPVDFWWIMVDFWWTSGGYGGFLVDSQLWWIAGRFLLDLVDLWWILVDFWWI